MAGNSYRYDGKSRDVVLVFMEQGIQIEYTLCSCFYHLFRVIRRSISKWKTIHGISFPVLL